MIIEKIMKNRDKVIPATYILLERENKFLTIRRCNTGSHDNTYQIPAGHIDKGELPTEAVIRETKEEIGIDLLSGDVSLIHISYRPKCDDGNDRVDFFFKSAKWVGEVKNMEPDKCDDLKWVSFDELMTSVASNVSYALECAQKGIFFKETS